MGSYLVFLLSILIITGALIFSLIAHTYKNKTYFFIGLLLVILASLLAIPNIQFLYYSIYEGDLLTIGFIGAFVISVTYLYLSQTKSTGNNDDVTDAFLDDIINAEDEEWDPES